MGRLSCGNGFDGMVEGGDKDRSEALREERMSRFGHASKGEAESCEQLGHGTHGGNENGEKKIIRT